MTADDDRSAASGQDPVKRPDSVIGAVGERVRLAQVESDRRLSVDDGIRLAALVEDLESKHARRKLSATLVWFTLGLFVVSNGLMWGTVGVILYIDDKTVTAYGAEALDQRLISENVIMSLIGATVAQIAVILLIITRDLFPKGGGEEG